MADQEEQRRHLVTMVMNAELTVRECPGDSSQVIVYATFSRAEIESRTGLTLPAT